METFKWLLVDDYRFDELQSVEQDKKTPPKVTCIYFIFVFVFVSGTTQLNNTKEMYVFLHSNHCLIRGLCNCSLTLNNPFFLTRGPLPSSTPNPNILLWLKCSETKSIILCYCCLPTYLVNFCPLWCKLFLVTRMVDGMWLKVALGSHNFINHVIE